MEQRPHTLLDHLRTRPVEIIGIVLTLMLVVFAWRGYKASQSGGAVAKGNTFPDWTGATDGGATSAYNGSSSTPTPPAPATPWYSSFLQGSWYTIKPGDNLNTPNKLANFFHIGTKPGEKPGWLAIAYNPNNKSLLGASYQAQGNNVIGTGTQVWIPTSTIDN